MAWPDEVQYAKDSSGNVVGLNNLGNLVKSPYEKMAKLGAKPVGFNYYSLLYEILISASGRDTFRPELLSMIQGTGANIVRIALPCFSSAEYLTLVHNTGSMPATVSDSNLRSTYITALDAVFAAANTYGLKLHICDSWGQSFLPVALGETLANGYISKTTATYNYMVSAAQWLFNRYKNNPAFVVYSIGNEYVTDASGTTAPTPTQLGVFLGGIADACRVVDPSVIVTTDIAMLGVSSLSTRITLNEYAADLKLIFKYLDSLNIHIYPEVGAFVGRSALDNAAFGTTNTNKLGLESIESVAQCFKAVADSMAIPFTVGEFGISTAHESDSNTNKKRKMTKILSKYASYILIWNVQDSTIGTGSQAVWFIDSGSARATSFTTVATEYNTAKPVQSRYMCGGIASLRNALVPTVHMSSSRVANATVEVVSTAAHQSTNLALMFWIKLDGNLTAFEYLMNFSDATQFNGVNVVGDSVASSNKFYADFRGAAGSVGNISGTLPPLTQGEWHHIAVSWEALEATTVITTWVNGMFWHSTNTAGTLTAIVVGTTLKMLGNTNGTPISLQDVALLPSITYDDVIAHMNGNVVPQSMLHVRALQNKTIVDISKNALPLTVKANVVVNISN